MGAFYRRLEGKAWTTGGNEPSRKLAVQFYNVMVHGVAYVEAGVESYQQKYEETVKTTYGASGETVW
ncbi:MAG: hypothetical protein IPP94_11585 [Ignavibacteria bacterium]|nr:hypothetical protein [Ignavibacteria bacterium]